jgi:ADP-dependent NAD(P)H-hydrate dehydratase / NAD(P)H-hydrate epimerase
MKIFSAGQVRAWDVYTIAHEPVAPIDLMERTAGSCVQWLLRHFPNRKPFHIFCGRGNNGGDGLAIARILIAEGQEVAVYVLDTVGVSSEDFRHNRERLEAITLIHPVKESTVLPEVPHGAIVVDALFGTGLNKPLYGIAGRLVKHLNEQSNTRISIDMPSGLFADAVSSENVVISAHHTLTFAAPKLALLLQENGPYTGEVHILDIGLSPAYLEATETAYEFVDETLVRSIYRPRNRFAHKGTFGHALVAAGSYGKMGAALMAASACLRGGAGLLSCHVPRCGVGILQTALPEAMVLPDADEEFLTAIPEGIERFSAIGIGPGIGSSDATVELLERYLQHAVCPLVLDADALNIFAQHPYWLQRLPAGSILTPHPKEFDRIFGAHSSDFDRIATALTQAKALQSVVLLKGHHTFIATPGGRGYFNSTGNAGMAKGGSGDVLTGLLAALLAQGYSPVNAAILGVWLHGYAGDAASRKWSAESMLPTDLAACLGDGFKALQEKV